MTQAPRKPLKSAVARRFDRRAPNYDQQSLWVQDPHVERHLLADLQEKSRILEAAGGTGAISLAATLQGHSVTCSDISPGMLRQARAKGLSVVKADMHHLPFPDAAFDVVLIRQGLQYANLQLALQEFKRVAAREIRTAQIVVGSDHQRHLWRKLFATLGQHDRVVFLKGEIEAEAACLSLKALRAEYFRGVERLIAPNLAARRLSMDHKRIAALIQEVDPDARPEGEDWLHAVEWEILQLRPE